MRIRSSEPKSKHHTLINHDYQNGLTILTLQAKKYPAPGVTEARQTSVLTGMTEQQRGEMILGNKISDFKPSHHLFLFVGFLKLLIKSHNHIEFSRKNFNLSMAPDACERIFTVYHLALIGVAQID